MHKRFKSVYLAIIIFVFCCVLIFGKQYINKTVFAEKSADAIAIRVIPNLKNYSAIRWYREQNFQGSPQSIIVDGYSGIRDGRTVYVNVGNISTSNVLYTNIYLISYNQQAEKQTVDIFSQILNHWKFNTNVSTIGQCSENNDINCVLDSDCQNSEYCNSQKAKIIRDVNRMENLVELNEAIEKYKNIYNNYPKLSAGSYLPNKTISVWPSWQKVLAQDLAMQLPDDPINKLGDCGDDRFHSITCWDKDNKEFADSNLTDPNINLPENSKVYVYITTKNGSSYNICSVMESGYIEGLENGACDSSESFVESDELINNQPVFTNDNLLGIVANEYKGYIEAFDLDGDELTWSINTGSAGQWATWADGNPPIIKYLTINNQIMIYSEKAGLEGEYNFSITINDNRGETNSIVIKSFSIIISKTSPIISIGDYIYYASSTNSLKYTFIAKDVLYSYPLSYILNGTLPNGFIPSFEQIGLDEFYTFSVNSTSAVFNPATESPINTVKDYSFNIEVSNNYLATTTENFNIQVINSKPVISNFENATTIVGYPIDDIIINVTDFENNIINLSLANTLPSGIVFNQTDNNTYQISGTPNLQVPIKLEHNNNIAVIDEYGAESNKSFLISVINNNPVFNEINCSKVVRINNEYSCDILAIDPDGHSIVSYTFQSGTYPAGLSINNNSGEITGPPTESGDFNIVIIATDEYGAIAEIGYDLTVNTYCGDGIKQTINTEGRGGENNNGQEDCDNINGVASSPFDSSENKQYSCTTPPECSLIEDCTGTCQYDGGWCGDETVQSGYGELCDNNSLNGQSCSDFGYDCGNLLCDSGCEFIEDNCKNIDCACAINTCVGETCIDANCNTVCNGIKACSICGSNGCEDGETCINCIVDCGGCVPEVGVCGVWISGGIITKHPTYPFTQPSEVSFGTDFVGNGDYPNNNITFSQAIIGTFDGIAIEPNTRLEMWTGPNFTGIKSFDIMGPALINNNLPYWVSNVWTQSPYNAINCWGYDNDLWENNCFWFDLGFMPSIYDNGSSRVTCF